MAVEQAGVLQRGVAGAWGINNIGLLVRTWGTVTAVYPAENCLYMDDGSALNDTPIPTRKTTASLASESVGTGMPMKALKTSWRLLRRAQG